MIYIMNICMCKNKAVDKLAMLDGPAYREVLATASKLS